MSESAEAETLERPAGTDEDQTGGAAPSAAEAEEALARRMGWRTPEELEAAGKKMPRYKTAAEFLEDGKKYEPFIKANNDKLEKALEVQRDKVTKLEADLKALGEFASKSTINAYNNAKREIEADIEAAAAAGDVAAVKAGTKALVALGTEAAAAAPIVKDGPDTAWQAAEDKWKSENKWFDGEEPGNRAMTVYALAQDRELADEKPNLSGPQRLAEVAKRVRAEFPEKFTNPNRERAAAVEGGGNARPSGARDYSNLPAEAKAFCDRMVKAGTMTRDAYVKGYQWDTK